MDTGGDKEITTDEHRVRLGADAVPATLRSLCNGMGNKRNVTMH